MFFAEHPEKHVLFVQRRTDPRTNRGQNVERMFFAVERGLFGVERRVFCCRALDISFCLFATQILRAHILQLTFDTQF